jgi:hypothetical protein
MSEEERLSKELVDLQIQIKELKRKERVLKEVLIKKFDEKKFSGAEFTHNHKKYSATLCETKVKTPLTEREKQNSIETCLVSLSNLNLDEKTKSEMIIRKLKEETKNSREGKSRKTLKILSTNFNG